MEKILSVVSTTVTKSKPLQINQRREHWSYLICGLSLICLFSLSACRLPVSVMGVNAGYIGCKENGQIRYFHIHEGIIDVNPFDTTTATFTAGTYKVNFGSVSTLCVAVRESQLPKGFAESHDHPEIEVQHAGHTESVKAMPHTPDAVTHEEPAQTHTAIQQPAQAPDKPEPHDHAGHKH